MDEHVDWMVDEEVAPIATQIMEDLQFRIREMLSVTPEWAQQQHQEMLKKIQSIGVSRPAWASTMEVNIRTAIREALETTLQSSMERTPKELEKGLGPLKERIIRLEEHLVSLQRENHAIAKTVAEIVETQKRYKLLLDYLARPWWKRIFGGRPQ